MGKVVCFGELLLRLVPSANGSWLTESHLPVFVGGAEANVAVALSNWNIPTRYITAIPSNFLGVQMAQFLEKKGVDTSLIHYYGDRVGLYYIPQGADLKNSGVIYDRAHSSFSALKPGMIDWEKIFEGADWFHFSAICPALNQTLAEVCEEGLQIARKKGITISLDLNHRVKLWQYGKNPNEVMPSLAHYCDIIMGNVWAAEVMLNVPVQKKLVEKNKKEAFLEQAAITSEKISKLFPSCKAVANTYRFTGEEGNINYYAALFSKNQFYSSSEYNTVRVIDKVGSGDCFMAGLIYGFKNSFSGQEIIDFAAASAFQKLFVRGDSTDKSVEEIKKSIKKYE